MTWQPLVGVTSYLEPAAWGVWNAPAALLPRTYLDAVTRAGGTPVLLPPQAGPVERLLDRLDALVLAGGPDLGPARYGAEPHPRTGETHELRDGWESALLEGALERGLPVLGVCRGMQLLNVALGGDLVQHLPDRVGDESHQVAPATYHRREVRIGAAGRLGAILGPAAKVLCYHHQAVGRLGEGLRATAWSTDGTVEAIELAGHRFTLGVQWHPEADPADNRLFEALMMTSRQE